MGYSGIESLDAEFYMVYMVVKRKKLLLVVVITVTSMCSKENKSLCLLTDHSDKPICWYEIKLISYYI